MNSATLETPDLLRQVNAALERGERLARFNAFLTVIVASLTVLVVALTAVLTWLALNAG